MTSHPKTPHHNHDASALVIAADPPPFDADTVAGQLSQQYARAQAGALEMIKFGAMVGAIEAEIEGPRRGRGSTGLKGWIELNCPEIGYRTAVRYRDLAKGAAAQLQCASVARLSAALTADEVSDEDEEITEGLKVLCFGKSARQLLFSFGEARLPGRPKGKKQDQPYTPLSTAEAEEMATVELEGIVQDLGSFLSRHMHLKVVDAERRRACRLRLVEMADQLR